MLHSLSDLICIAPDYAQPELLRNHCEVLRCYERLTMHFTDHCLDQIILQLRNNNDKERVKALLILTHLVNSSEKAIQGRVDIFLQVCSILGINFIYFFVLLMLLYCFRYYQIC